MYWCVEFGELICDIGIKKENFEQMYLMIDFSNLFLDVWWYVDEKLKDVLIDLRKCYEWVLSNGIFKLGEIESYFY